MIMRFHMMLIKIFVVRCFFFYYYTFIFLHTAIIGFVVCIGLIGERLLLMTMINPDILEKIVIKIPAIKRE